MNSKTLSIVATVLALVVLAVCAADALAAPTVSVYNTVVLDPTATYDTTNNGMVVMSTPIATINGYVTSAYNLGAWNMPGITSSLAATNASHNTGVGVISGADYMTGGSTFYGMDMTGGSAWSLLAYTYEADANFDGVVSGSDTARLIAGFGGAPASWYSGDFNHDGVVSGSDTALLIHAFGTQAGTPSAFQPVNPHAPIVAGASAVPEPSTFALILTWIGVGLFGFLRRRSQRG